MGSPRGDVTVRCMYYQAENLPQPTYMRTPSANNYFFLFFFLIMPTHTSVKGAGVIGNNEKRGYNEYIFVFKSVLLDMLLKSKGVCTL